MTQRRLKKRFEVRIAYSGEALTNHEMDVELFASAVQANARLFKEICKTTIGPELNASIKIRAIEKNGITADLAFYLTQAADTLHFLAENDFTQAIDDIMKLAGYALKTGWGVYSIYLFVKKLKQRKIKRELTKFNNDAVEIALDDGSTITIPRKMYEVVINDHVKRSLNTVLKPLKRKGIDTFRQYIHDATVEEQPFLETSIVEKSELPEFAAFIGDMTTEIREYTVIGELDRPSYKGNTGGWKLTVKDEPVKTINIRDSDFIYNVKEGITPVPKGDLFEVHLTETTTTKEDGSKSRKLEALKVCPYRRLSGRTQD